MKRAFLTLALPLLLAGCAQVFETNLYSPIDKPAKLDAAALGKKSVAELNALAEDPDFYDQLRNDPAALAAIQASLIEQRNSATTDQAKIDAAAALVTITSSGSRVAELKDASVTNLGSIQDALKEKPIDFVKVLKIFLTGQNEGEIKETLDNLVIMSDSLAVLQQVAKNPVDKTIVSSVFFSGTTNPTTFAQSALMTALAKALVTDSVTPGPGTSAAAAALLVQDSPIFPSTVEKRAFGKAYDADAATTKVTDFKPTTYSYAYVATIKGKLSF